MRINSEPISYAVIFTVCWKLKVNLHFIAIYIFSICMGNIVALNLGWIPRCLDDLADFVSKFVDCDGWVVSEWLLSYSD